MIPWEHIEPGEVYVWARFGAVDVLSPYAPPVELIGKPCLIKAKAPNRSVSVLFAHHPEPFQVFPHTLERVPGRVYRPWPPKLEEINEQGRKVVQHYK